MAEPFQERESNALNGEKYSPLRVCRRIIRTQSDPEWVESNEFKKTFQVVPEIWTRCPFDLVDDSQWAIEHIDPVHIF